MKIEDNGFVGAVKFEVEDAICMIQDGTLAKPLETQVELHDADVSIVQSRIFECKTLSIIGRMKSGTVLNVQVVITEDMIEHLLKPEVFFV